MGAPSFKDCVKADIFGVFLNTEEFSAIHTVNGKKMTVQVDENELLERDKAKMGTHQDGLYKARRLIYVARSEFGQRPAIGAMLNLDGKTYKVKDCTEEAGIFAIELEAARTVSSSEALIQIDVEGRTGKDHFPAEQPAGPDRRPQYPEKRPERHRPQGAETACKGRQG